jgi:hypothetical protein
MNHSEKHDFSPSKRLGLLYLLIGLSILGGALFAPDAQYHAPLKFFAIAKMSRWHKYDEWISALCSIRIFIFSFGAILLLFAIEELLVTFRQNVLAIWVSFFLPAPILGCLAGLFYLLKSVM